MTSENVDNKPQIVSAAVVTPTGQVSDEDQARHELLELVQRLGGRASVRDLQKHSRRYPTADAARVALNDLVNKSYGSWKEVKGRGRPTAVFVLAEPVGAVDTTATDADAAADAVDGSAEGWLREHVAEQNALFDELVRPRLEEEAALLAEAMQPFQEFAAETMAAAAAMEGEDPPRCRTCGCADLRGDEVRQSGARVVRTRWCRHCGRRMVFTVKPEKTDASEGH